MKWIITSTFLAVFGTAAYAGDQNIDETSYAVSGYDVVGYFVLLGQKAKDWS